MSLSRTPRPERGQRDRRVARREARRRPRQRRRLRRLRRRRASRRAAVGAQHWGELLPRQCLSLRGFVRKDDPKYIDLLDEDKPLAGQKFACISFISPEDIIKQKNTLMGGESMKRVFLANLFQGESHQGFKITFF